MSKIFHDWASILDQRNPSDVHCILLDWTPVFDKVPHNLLINKLHK